VRTTLEVGRARTVLPPNSFLIASSYSGSVVTGSLALTCTIWYPPTHNGLSSALPQAVQKLKNSASFYSEGEG
jgi:hypothetical protein